LSSFDRIFAAKCSIYCRYRTFEAYAIFDAPDGAL